MLIECGCNNAHHAKVVQCREANLWVRRREDPFNLRADPFAGERAREPRGVADRRSGHRLNREFETGGEPSSAKGAQCVLLETLGGVTDRAQDACVKVFSSAVRINEGAINHRISPLVACEAERHGVHGEVAPGKVAVDGADEVHRIWSPRVATRTIRAEGGHFTDGNFSRDANRAEAILVLRIREGGAELIRRCVGGEIPVGWRASSEHVAHRATHNVRSETVGVQSPHQPCDVFWSGGAECRLVVHAPLAVTPSPMKRKSRHAE